MKHYKQHPTDPNKVIYKHPQTGKKIIKPKPIGSPGKQGGFIRLGTIGAGAIRMLGGVPLFLWPNSIGCSEIDCDGDGIPDMLYEINHIKYDIKHVV